MSPKKIIYVGAKPDLVNIHAGGQTTASLGLIEFARQHDIDLEIIDSAQSSFPLPSLSKRITKAGKRMLQLVRLLSGDSVTGVIIFSSSGFSFYEKSLLALVCRMFNVRCLLFVRSGHFMSACEHSVITRKLSRFFLCFPHKLGVQGTNWVDFYKGIGINPEKTIIIHNWLSPGREVADEIKTYKADSNSRLTFLFVGWLVKKKGVLELIEAIERSPLLQNCDVLIAGGGDLYEQLEHDIVEKKLVNIELLGWQTPAEIDQLLSRSHVFVLPTYAEGFSNALLEAMSQGLPAVVTPVGAISDSAQQGKNAELIVPADVQSLRTAMEKFVLSPQLVEQYSKWSLEIARTLHDRDKNCSKLFDYFD